MWRPGIRRWALSPLFVSVLVYGLLAWGAVALLNPRVEAAAAWWSDFSGLDFLGEVLWVLVAAVSLLIMTYSFVLVASLVACPFNAILAESVALQRSGRKTPGTGILGLLKSTPGMLIQETKKLLYFVVWAIPVGIVSLVLLFVLPPLGVIIWTSFSAWMLALEFSDYPMDNEGLKFREMRRALKRKRWTAFGFGLATFFFATIPVLNLLTVPAAVCGATLMWLESIEPSLDRQAA